MRTADSVLFTCWPPAPPARYVSISMSSSLIVDLHAVVHQRGHVHGGEGGLAALLRVEGR